MQPTNLGNSVICGFPAFQFIRLWYYNICQYNLLIFGPHEVRQFGNGPNSHRLCDFGQAEEQENQVKLCERSGSLPERTSRSCSKSFCGSSFFNCRFFGSKMWIFPDPWGVRVPWPIFHRSFHRQAITVINPAIPSIREQLGRDWLSSCGYCLPVMMSSGH